MPNQFRHAVFIAGCKMRESALFLFLLQFAFHFFHLDIVDGLAKGRYDRKDGIEPGNFHQFRHHGLELAGNNEGTAVFPLIPMELGVHPLLLGLLHAYVFLDGSDASVVNPDAATEALEYLASYLQRLTGRELRKAQEDMETLVGFAKEEKWPKQYVLFLKSFLVDNGVGQAATLEEEESE